MGKTIRWQMHREVCEVFKNLTENDRMSAMRKVILMVLLAAVNTSAFATSDCVFPNSSNVAPDWVCDAPVEGYGITAVGMASIFLTGQVSEKDKLPPYQSAFLEAMVQLAQLKQVQIQRMIKQYVETTGQQHVEEVDKVAASVEKKITSEKFGNILVENMLKQYREKSGSDKALQVNIFTSVSRLSMKQPCFYSMKSYVELEGKEKRDAESSEEGRKCTFQDVAKELARNGIEVAAKTISPGGDLFLLVGVKEEALNSMVEAAVKTSKQNDAELWRKFKANSKARDDLSKEIGRQGK
jgi:hypothetical protein